jgi:methyltransferase family protein
VNGLNVSSGEHYCPDWINFDLLPQTQLDLRADLFHLPFPDATFTKVYAGHTLEHLAWDHIPQALTEIRRIMTPGAELMVVGPDIERAVLTRQPQWLLDAIVIDGPTSGPGHRPPHPPRCPHRIPPSSGGTGSGSRQTSMAEPHHHRLAVRRPRPWLSTVGSADGNEPNAQDAAPPAACGGVATATNAPKRRSSPTPAASTKARSADSRRNHVTSAQSGRVSPLR